MRSNFGGAPFGSVIGSPVVYGSKVLLLVGREIVAMRPSHFANEGASSLRAKRSNPSLLRRGGWARASSARPGGEQRLRVLTRLPTRSARSEPPSPARRDGLLRRSAPRNDGIECMRIIS